MALRGAITRRLTNTVEEMRSHYNLFGPRGIVLVAKARLLRRQVEVSCTTAGVPYNMHLRLRTSDIAVFCENLVDDQYEWEYPKSPNIIVDAGANIGLTAVLYANKYPQARIFAIEPEPSNFEMLKKNTKLYPNITAVHAALWKEDCDLEILNPEVDLWGFWGFQMRKPESAGDPGRKGLARGITLRELMTKYSIDYIDLLKIDIEGAEKEVFEGSTEWIDEVGAIVIELHDRFKPGCSRAVDVATRNFEVSQNRGDTRFLRRSEETDKTASQPRSIAKTAESRLNDIRVTLPMHIVSTI
jgi:FkbM family methyltransferase